VKWQAGPQRSATLGEMASIVCPSCTLPVALDDVDLGAKLAKCRRCSSVFDFREQVRTPQEEARRRRDLVAPPGYRLVTRAPSSGTVDRAGYRDAAEGPRAPVVIHRNWRSWRSVPRALGALLMGCWSTTVLWSTLARPVPTATGVLFVCFVFGGPGVLAVGAALIELLNRTSIVIDDERVVVGHAPFPWFGASTTRSASIRSLHVASRTRLGGQPPLIFDIVADTPESAKQVLVKGLPTAEGARFVARVITDRLRLPEPD
jgi:hypothetical protein